MVRAYGLFPVTLVANGYFIWFIWMVTVNGILIYVQYNEWKYCQFHCSIWNTQICATN